MPVTTPPTIDTLPPAPVRGQAGFSDATGAFLEALPDFGDQMQAAGEATADNAQVALDAADDAVAAQVEAETASALAVASSGYVGTSSTPNSIGTGAKSFHMDVAGLSFEADMFVVAISKSNPDNRLYFNIDTWDGVDDMTGTVASGGTSGSGGPYDDWIVVAAAFLQPGADATDMLVGTSDIAPITPASIYDALAEVTLTDAATIAVDMSTFINAKVTLGGNRTLGNPTNAKPGQTGRIRAIQDGTGSRTLSFASNWKRQSGAPTLTTTPALFDLIEYDVITASLIVYDLIKNPS